MRPEAESALQAWEWEHGTTLKVLRAIPEGRLGVRAAEKGWRLGDLAWHLCSSERFFCVGALGLAVPGEDPVPKDRPPATAAAMAAAREASHAALFAAARAKDDAWMEEVVEFYGTRLRRTEVLHLMLRHEAHHRGQLTVYLRLAGARVPGTYGPSADDAG
jgi:uncharacterized damage-inducible protein DinB